jgi:hypothetical protein
MPNARPGRLFISGSSLDIAGLIDSSFEKDFNLRCQAVTAREISAAANKEQAAGLSLSAALGFSYLRKKEDIIFFLPEAQIKKEIKSRIKQLLLLGVFLTYVFILAGLLTLMRINNLQAYRDRLKESIATLRKDTGGLFDIAQKINVIKQYWGAKSSVITCLHELMRVCPDNITVSNFTWESQKSFSIRGYASQMQDIFNFVTELEGSKVFKGAQTRYTRRRKVKDKEMIDFEIGMK